MNLANLPLTPEERHRIYKILNDLRYICEMTNDQEVAMRIDKLMREPLAGMMSRLVDPPPRTFRINHPRSKKNLAATISIDNASLTPV